MSAGPLLCAVGAGVLAGVAGGLFGVGGGLVLIPFLTGYFKLTQHQAHGTSLAVIGVTAWVSLIAYAAFSNVAWWTAAIVSVASVLTARVGARLATRTPPARLARAFAVFLVVVALRLLWEAPRGVGGGLDHGPTFHLTSLGIGLAVGLLSGYMGVGGGIVAVPAFTLLLGMSQQLAQGTSLAVIAVVAPVGAAEHSRHGNLVGRVVPGLALGAALGGPLASWCAQRLPQHGLARAFAVFLLANAAYMWRRAGRERGPRGESASTAGPG